MVAQQPVGGPDRTRWTRHHEARIEGIDRQTIVSLPAVDRAVSSKRTTITRHDLWQSPEQRASRAPGPWETTPAALARATGPRTGADCSSAAPARAAGGFRVQYAAREARRQGVAASVVRRASRQRVEDRVRRPADGPVAAPRVRVVVGKASDCPRWAITMETDLSGARTSDGSEAQTDVPIPSTVPLVLQWTDRDEPSALAAD